MFWFVYDASRNRFFFFFEIKNLVLNYSRRTRNGHCLIIAWKESCKKDVANNKKLKPADCRNSYLCLLYKEIKTNRIRNTIDLVGYSCKLAKATTWQNTSYKSSRYKKKENFLQNSSGRLPSKLIYFYLTSSDHIVLLPLIVPTHLH